MTKRRVLFCLALLVASSGSDCSLTVGTNDVPLHQATAFISIEHTGDDDATVRATITRGFASVRLGEDQSVAVNDVELKRIGPGGQYVATIEPANEYVITVHEPTRGVENTTVSPPPDFTINTPVDGGDASLSGFTIEWSGADPSLLVALKLMQTLLDEQLELELGPFEDIGTVMLTSSQLQDAGFGQGADLTVELTKNNEVDGIAGFNSATVQVRRNKSITVTPGP